MLEHAIADMHQLAHDRADDQLLRFAFGGQSLRKGFDGRTAGHGRDRWPVQRGAHSRLADFR